VKFQKLADAGGGQVYFIHPNEDLAGVYGQILSELRSQYTVAFYPKDTAPPAAWTKIDVEVTGRKGLTARTVSGVPSRGRNSSAARPPAGACYSWMSRWAENKP
jgi:hypothetical protein